MRVWIGCLACYNEGNLIGNWYDAIEAGEVTSRSLHASHIKRDDDFLDLLAASHEELWVMDSDETFGWLTRESSPSEAQAIAEAIQSIEDHGDDPEIVLAWTEYVGNREEIIRDGYDRIQANDFADAFRGVYESETDFAYEWVESTDLLHGLDESVANYFDYEAYGRDLAMDFYSTRVSNGLAFFWTN